MAHHPFQSGDIVQKLQQILCVVPELRKEFLRSIILQIKYHPDNEPDSHHGQHVLLLFQLLELAAELGNGLLPLDKGLVLQLDIKSRKPFPNGVRFTLVTAFRRLQKLFHLTGGNGLSIIIALLKCHIAAQREHTTDGRLDLMDRATVVLQQNAVIVIALGCQSDDGDSGVVTDMEHAILVVEINRADFQFLGHIARRFYQQAKNRISDTALLNISIPLYFGFSQSVIASLGKIRGIRLWMKAMDSIGSFVRIENTGLPCSIR